MQKYIIGLIGGIALSQFIISARATTPSTSSTYIIGLDMEQLSPTGNAPQRNMLAKSIKVERKCKLKKLQGNVQITNLGSVKGTFIEALFTWYLTSYQIPTGVPICCDYSTIMRQASDRIAGEIVETTGDAESHTINLDFNTDIPEGYYLTTVIDCNNQYTPIHAEVQVYAVIEDTAQMNWIIDGENGMKGNVEAKPYMYWYINFPVNKTIAYGSPTDVPATYVDGYGNDQIAIIRYSQGKVYLDENYSGGVAEIIKNLNEVIITDTPGYTSRIQIL